MNDPNLIAVIGLLVFNVFILVLVLWLVPLNLWIAARTCGTDLPLAALVVMRLRRIPPRLIVEPLIASTQAGVPLRRALLEAHYLAGGDPKRVTMALIGASKAGISLDFERAAAIDLAGRDVFESVKAAAEPRVIDCPPQSAGRDTIEARSKDGIAIRAKARVTIKANLDRLIGGAPEETLLARISEGIVTAIVASPSHEAVIENPRGLCELLMRQNLAAGTAFDIVSIDLTVRVPDPRPVV